MTASFDIELMNDTADRIGTTLSRDLETLERSHGADFAASVAANVGINLLVCVLASAPDNAQRMAMATSVIMTMAKNLKSEVAGIEAEKIIAKAMEKASGA